MGHAFFIKSTATCRCSFGLVGLVVSFSSLPSVWIFFGTLLEAVAVEGLVLVDMGLSH